MTPGGNPFIGARPYGEDEGFLFHGRASETATLAAKVWANSLTLVRGRSGVGKTSLVRAALVRALERRAAPGTRVRVLVLREWTPAVASKEDPLAHALASALGAKDLLPPVELLRAHLGDHQKIVLILDQFEEVLRGGGPSGERAVIDGVAALHGSRLPVHLLISMREEYVGAMGPLEALAGGIYRWSYFLQPLDIESAHEAFQRTAKSVEGTRLDEGALRQVLDWARHRPGAELLAREPNLLVAQAILHQLWERAAAQAEGDVVIDAPLLARFARDRAPEEVVRTALVDWIERAVSERPAQAAPGWQGAEAALGGVVRVFAARMARHLSSGGYKVPLSQSDLRERVLRRELDLVGVPLGALQDILNGKEPAWPRWKASPAEILSGPARSLGWTEAEFLPRLLSTYAHVLERLTAGNILKITAEPDRGAMVELMHDGLGDAFNRWAEREESTLEHAAASPSAVVGGLVIPAPREDAAPLLVREVVLRGCAVQSASLDETVPLRNVVFERANLTGTVFLRCDLRGVTFRECDLDGVYFERCRLGGPEGGVRFEGCSGDGMCITDCTLDGVAFEGCTFNQLTLDESELAGRVAFDGTYVASSIFAALSPVGKGSLEVAPTCGGEYNSWDGTLEGRLGTFAGAGDSGRFKSPRRRFAPRR